MMTKIEKDLILEELCAFLPYDITVEIEWAPVDHPDKIIVTTRKLIESDIRDFRLSDTDLQPWVLIKSIKPYLRPLSSMTDEEMEEMHAVLSPKGTAQYKCDRIETPISHFGDMIPYEYMRRVVRYLRSKHFDCGKLIDIGLANIKN